MGSDERAEKESAFQGLPGYNETIADITVFNPGLLHTEICCGECEEPRAGIRTYTVIYPAFLFVFVYVWRDEVLRCPRCMRAYLAFRFLPALLLANVLAPLVLVWWLVLLVRTYMK